MAETICEIVETRWTPYGSAGLIHCPSAVQPLPGQYLLATAVEQPETLPVPLFRAGWQSSHPDYLPVAAPLPDSWTPGVRIHARGVLGSGFHLPPAIQAAAFACFGSGLDRLMPLIEQALRQGSSVSVFSERIPSGLPASVEILPLEQLPESLTWASYLALDLPIDLLSGWRSLVGLSSGEPCPCRGEVLVRTAMPCGGRASCGVCSLRTRHGWQFICKDGPVFALQDLD